MVGYILPNVNLFKTLKVAYYESLNRLGYVYGLNTFFEQYLS